MRKTIKKISSNWRIFPSAIISAYILRVIVEILTSANPYITKRIVDSIQLGNVHNDFYRLIGIFFVATILDQTLTKISEIKRTIFKEYYFIAKNEIAYKKIFGLDYQQYIDLGTGKILKRIERGLEAEWNMFDGIVKISSIALIRFGVSFFMIFLYLPSSIAMLVIGILILLWLVKFTRKKAGPLYTKVKDIWEDASRQESKMIMEKQLINLSGKEESEISFYKNMLNPLKQLSWKADAWGGLPYELMFVLFRLVEGVGYVIIGRQIWANTSTFGDIILLVGYIRQLWWPFDIIAHAIYDWSKQKARYESLQEMLALPNKIIDGKEKIALSKGDIVFENIIFGYKDDKKVFDGFDLSIAGGTTCALVGHSGSGKSTLIKLLLRYYDIAQGNIYIDGQILSTIQRSSWYKELGYLSQEPSIFDGTIQENLLYGVDASQTVTEDDMRKALSMAQIDDHIKSLALGLQTEIGEKGVKLSGGEKQRLAIARIFLKNPKVLILDEPTSALDSISEHAITKVMKELFVNRTVIIIAHRLQTVMHADNIVVLDHGKIVQQGNHTELLDQDGVYKKLVNLQKGTVEE